MPVSPRPALLILVFLAAISPARAGERDQLNACEAMLARVAQAANADKKPDDAELQRCRQIIKEWTLRDSRRSVDEHGQPLR
jgi:hypothetical protein